MYVLTFQTHLKRHIIDIKVNTLENCAQSLNTCVDMYELRTERQTLCGKIHNLSA